MDKEKKVFKIEIEPKKISNLVIEKLKKIGAKAEINDSTDQEIKSYELDPETVIARWKQIFSKIIQEKYISNDDLSKWAQRFCEEPEKIIEWINKQPDPSNFLIVHKITNRGEGLVVHGKEHLPRRYGVYVYFQESEIGLGFKSDKDFI